MATLWDVVTGNSTLPIQAGNTFWDHIQNQKAGGGTGVDRTFSGRYKSRVSNNIKSQLAFNAVKSKVTSVVTTSKISPKVKSKVSK